MTILDPPDEIANADGDQPEPITRCPICGALPRGTAGSAGHRPDCPNNERKHHERTS